MLETSMRSRVIVACVALLAAGCEILPVEEEPTPLQIQAFQTREFQTDKSLAFGSVVSVFQDLGYIVQSADKDTGFITAASPASAKTNVWESLEGSTSSGQTKATAFIEEVRQQFVTVRLNFVDTKRVSNKQGQVIDSDTRILDPQVYRAAFERIENAIFVRSGTRAVQPAD